MKITEIHATAKRVFNHPNECFSELHPEVMLVALVESGEDVGACTSELQAQAEKLVDEHAERMFESISKTGKPWS